MIENTHDKSESYKKIDVYAYELGKLKKQLRLTGVLRGKSLIIRERYILSLCINILLYNIVTLKLSLSNVKHISTVK